MIREILRKTFASFTIVSLVFMSTGAFAFPTSAIAQGKPEDPGNSNNNNNENQGPPFDAEIEEFKFVEEPGECLIVGQEFSVEGIATAGTPPGQIHQYHVQIDWGDGETDDTTEDGGNGFGPDDPDTRDFGGSHTYTEAATDLTITARIYHQTPPGNDNQADSIATIDVCVIEDPEEEEDYEVTIYKYIDGVQADATSADNNLFPFIYSSDDTQEGSVVDEDGSVGPSTYTTTLPMKGAYTLSVAEDTSDTSLFVANEHHCEPGKFYLEGYSSGTTLENAQNAEISTNHPYWDNPLETDKHIIIYNKSCPGPEDPPPGQCDLVVVSNEDDFVVEGSADAVYTYDGHPSWTANVGDLADWIWESFQVADPLSDTTRTFTKTFESDGNVDSAMLKIAADNSYHAYLNDVLVADDQTEFNYLSGNEETVDVSDELINGTNTLKFVVKNWALADSTSETNPAGLLYRLDIKDDDCHDGEPQDEDITVTIYKYLETDNGITPATAEGTESASFAMSATWDDTRIGAGTGEYALDADGFNGGDPYEATTSEMDPGADYSTYEIIGGNVVSTVEQCAPGKYLLKGYKIGSTLEEAKGASTTESASFTNLLEDKHVIVVNEACDDIPDEPDQCELLPDWAYAVEASDQGERKDGSDVLPARSNPASVLGSADGVFYSLGLRDGAPDPSVTISFEYPVFDGAGDDLAVYEVTNGRDSYPLEKALVEVKQYETDSWVSLGEITSQQNGGVALLDLDGSGLDWIQFVRVSDQTNPVIHAADADGFDVDAIKAFYQGCEQIPDDPTPGQCDLVVISDSLTVADTGAEEKLSVVLSFIHSAWTAIVGDDASWIWGTDGPDEPWNEETVTFTRTFQSDGSVDSAILKVAFDNDAEIFVNGTSVGSSFGVTRFASGTEMSIDIKPFLVSGPNELRFVVTNLAADTEDPQANPAGLLYRLDIADSECTFDDDDDDNTPEDDDTPGGGGGRLASSFNSDDDDDDDGDDEEGEILGATTGSCGQYLFKYLHRDAPNPLWEMLKLKAFLNVFEKSGLLLNGAYDQATFDAVEKYQTDHRNSILEPWVERGFLPNEFTPTGYVYVTTRKHINERVCPSYEEPLLPIVPDINIYNGEYN